MPVKNAKKQLVGWIFPRYHQLTVTRKLVAAVTLEGPGNKYLVQHSAGSGKTNSIAWTAHFLADLHDAEDQKVFDTVIVISDRTVLDDQLREAIMSFERAMFHAPEYSDAHREMAALLLGLNLREEAIEAYQRGLKGNPHDDMTLALLLHQQGHICDWEGMAPYLDRLPELGTGTQAVSPWGMLALEDAPARHRIRSELGIAARFGGAERTPIAPPAARPEKIKVGYFTSDIHHHATMFLLGRMIALHDRDRFEVHAYSYGAEDSSAYRSLFDRFYDVHRMDDQEVAALARKAGLDIAIDLKGHTKDGRLGILSYGAAPVQMSYLGYPGTSGADFIDYMIADRVVVPDAQRAHYSESIR